MLSDSKVKILKNIRPYLAPSSKGQNLYIKKLKGYPPAVSVRLSEQALEIIPDYIVRRYVDFLTNFNLRSTE